MQMLISESLSPGSFPQTMAALLHGPLAVLSFILDSLSCMYHKNIEILDYLLYGG
jgi:hypothetical protein